jgi:hypothetical protein
MKIHGLKLIKRCFVYSSLVFIYKSLCESVGYNIIRILFRSGQLIHSYNYASVAQSFQACLTWTTSVLYSFTSLHHIGINFSLKNWMINLSWYILFTRLPQLDQFQVEQSHMDQSQPFHRSMNSSCYTAASQGSTSVSTMHQWINFSCYSFKRLPLIDLHQASSLYVTMHPQHTSMHLYLASMHPQHASMPACIFTWPACILAMPACNLTMPACLFTMPT